MNSIERLLCDQIALVLLCTFAVMTPTVVSADEAQTAPNDPRRVQAELLHEAIHGALQVMHRDFFNDEDPIAIPSQSLEDVFDALEERHGITAKWLVVETDVVNVDHKPANDFERTAVVALKNGDETYSRVENGEYRYVGAIPLSSQCLKCHLKLRTDVEPRTAGLVLTFPKQSESDD